MTTLPTSPPERLSGLWRRHRADLLALLLFTLITLALSWPLLLHLRTLIHGDGGDTWLWGWMAWWRTHILQTGQNLMFIDLQNAPFGTDHAFRTYWLTIYSLTGLSLLFGEVAAFNLMVLGAQVLACGFTYGLARQMGASRGASFAAGLVFGFSAYLANHMQTHVDQAQAWVLPMFLMSLVNMARRRDLPAALLMGLCFGVAAHFHAYYGYFNALAALTFYLVEAGRRVRAEGWKAAIDGRELGLYALGAGLGLLIYLPELIGIVRDYRGVDLSPLRPVGALARDREWFFSASARPWDYFIPPESHPWLGWIGTALYPQIEAIPVGASWFWFTAGDPIVNEQYLGYANLIMAGYAIWRWRRGQLQGAQAGAERDRWAGIWLWMALAGFLFSLPPTIPILSFLGDRWPILNFAGIPTPNLLLMLIGSPLRIVRRAILLMLIPLAIFVAWGLDDLWRRLGQRRTLPALMGFGLLFAFESYQPPMLVSGEIQPEYLYLAEEPGVGVIHSLPYGMNRAHIAEQRYHGLPITDTMAMDASFQLDNLNRIMQVHIGAQDAPDFAGKLAAIGVTHLVDWTGDPPAPGLVPVFESTNGITYRVEAEPVPLILTYSLRYGFWQGPGDWAWTGPEYQVWVWNPLNEAVDLRIEALLADPGAAGDLRLARGLSPEPELFAISGINRPNPYLQPPYDVAPLTAGVTGQGRLFEVVDIRPGETLLIFRWEGVREDHWPEVRRLAISAPGLEVEVPRWLAPYQELGGDG